MEEELEIKMTKMKILTCMLFAASWLARAREVLANMFWSHETLLSIVPRLVASDWGELHR